MVVVVYISSNAVCGTIGYYDGKGSPAPLDRQRYMNDLLVAQIIAHPTVVKFTYTTVDRNPRWFLRSHNDAFIDEELSRKLPPRGW